MNKGAKPFNSDFMRPKDEPVKKPEVVSTDMKGPLPAAIQEKPPVILLPVATAPASEPVEEMKPPEPKPFAALPPDIDPDQVIIVSHDAKKAAGERFKYTDRPLKPLSGEGRKPEVIKYNDKRSGEIIKYKAAPVTPRAAAETEKPVAEVFKYKPVRIEIKS